MLQNDTRGGRDLGYTLSYEGSVSEAVEFYLTIDLEAPLGAKSCVLSDFPSSTKHFEMVPAMEYTLSYCAEALAAWPYFLELRDDIDYDATNHTTGVNVTQTPKDFASELRFLNNDAGGYFNAFDADPASPPARGLNLNQITLSDNTEVYLVIQNNTEDYSLTSTNQSCANQSDQSSVNSNQSDSCANQSPVVNQTCVVNSTVALDTGLEIYLGNCSVTLNDTITEIQPGELGLEVGY
jgi:hypothetical protein